VKAQYRNNDACCATDNQIKPGLQLVNTGSAAVALSAVKVRYWFTRDGGSTTVNTWCDYAFLGCGSITRTVAAVSPARPNADTYVEVGFTGGTLAAGGSTGEIQLRFSKADWSSFNEANDYSRGTNTSYADRTQITVYVNGTLVWGTEP
jgi:Cellulose binding domain